MDKQKDEYWIFIKETLNKGVKVKANSWQEAYEIVRKQYRKGDIVLTADDFCDYEIY